MKQKFVILMLVLVACSPSRDKEVLKQSFALHEEAIKKGNEIEEKIDQIERLTSTLSDSSKISFLDSLEVLKKDLESWESTIVEVPGFEHDHHDHEGHDHDHDHSPAPDLTPEMVLEIQEDLKNRALKLDERTQLILDDLAKN